MVFWTKEEAMRMAQEAVDAGVSETNILIGELHRPTVTQKTTIVIE